MNIFLAKHLTIKGLYNDTLQLFAKMLNDFLKLLFAQNFSKSMFSMFLS